MFVVRYRRLYAAELLEKTDERFPGAVRIRKTSPGAAISNLEGAAYHGSWLGGNGAGDFAGSAEDEIVNESRSMDSIDPLGIDIAKEGGQVALQTRRVISYTFVSILRRADYKLYPT